MSRTLKSRLGIFGDRNYALYALGNTVSGLGTWAQRVGIGWLSWELSHSASWVGLVSLASFLPLVVSAPLFGGVLDRSDPKRYAIVTNSVLTALAIALYFIASLHLLTIGRLCALSVLIGIANGAYHPVRLSLVNEVAPPGRLAQAIATNSILFNLSRSIGPALAGIAIATLGVETTFAINAVSYAGIIVALAMIEIRTPVRHESAGFFRDIREGIHYASRHAFIRQLMLLSMVASIFGRGVIELLPAIAGGLFQRGSVGLAALTTASGVGAVLGGLLLSRFHSSPALDAFVLRSAIGVGILVVLVGLAPDFLLAACAVLMLGILSVICGVGLQVQLQKSLDTKFRGRVLGLWGMTNVAGPGIGGAIVGAADHLLGLRGATIVSGVLCAALGWWIGRRGSRNPLLPKAHKV